MALTRLFSSWHGAVPTFLEIKLPLAGLGPLKLREEIRRGIIPGKPRYQASSGHALHASGDLASEKRRGSDATTASWLASWSFPPPKLSTFFSPSVSRFLSLEARPKSLRWSPPVPCYVGHAPLELCVLVDPLGLDDLASSIPGCAPGFKRSSGCLTRN
jgi:hypothetical protein